MTDKQKLKSLEKKMQRIEDRNPEIDIKHVSRFVRDIELYYDLRQEHFHLKFNMEHCQSCGKKYKE